MYGKVLYLKLWWDKWCSSPSDTVVHWCVRWGERSCQDCVLSLPPSHYDPRLHSRPSLLRLSGRRSASGRAPAAPDGSCCQQTTWIVWTLRAKLRFAEVRRNHSKQNWPTSQWEEMYLSRSRTAGDISALYQYNSEGKTWTAERKLTLRHRTTHLSTLQQYSTTRNYKDAIISVVVVVIVVIIITAPILYFFTSIT